MELNNNLRPLKILSLSCLVVKTILLQCLPVSDLYLRHEAKPKQSTFLLVLSE